MPNPNVPQGTLNRLRASLIVRDNTSLNLTPSFLGKDMISISFDGAADTPIDTATGIVHSPEPYQRVSVSAHLLKSQALANLWKQQLETIALIGDITVKPDTITLDPYQISNATILNVSPLKFDGTDAGWIVILTGVYYINGSLWNL